jgi:hypothetical protein
MNQIVNSYTEASCTAPRAAAISQYKEKIADEPQDVLNIISRQTEQNLSSRLSTYKYTIKDTYGNERIETCTIPFRPEQDVVDVLLYSVDQDGQIHIYVTEKIRPALTQRTQLGLRTLAETGKQLNLPGFYYGEDGTAVSIDSKCKAYAESLGLLPLQSVQNIGAGYFTDGYSSELVLPRALRVQELPFHQTIAYGAAFQGEQSIFKMSPEDILLKFESGVITDSRLVQATLRFCEQQAYQLKTTHTLYQERIVNVCDSAIPIYSKEDIRKHLNNNGSQITNVHELPQYDATKHRAYAAEATLMRRDPTLNETFSFDVVTHADTDTIHTTPFFYKDQTLYFVVNFVERPVAILRNKASHLVYSNFGLERVEGIFTRTNDTHTQEAIQAQAVAHLKDAWELRTVGTPLCIGHGTISPGFNPTDAWFFMSQIDPSHTIENPGKKNLMAVSFDDIGALIASGEINSGELITSYYLAAHTLGIAKVATPEAHDPASALKQELAAIFNGVSQARRILASQHPGVYDALMAHPLGQKIIAYLQNESASITFARSQSSIEEGLFDGYLHLSPLQSAENTHEHGLLSFHDVMHAILFDPSVRGMTFEEYRDAILARESDALWFSEVFIPTIYGFEQYRQDTNKTSFGEVLVAAGITEIATQRQIIKNMVMRGQLDGRIATSPRYHEIQWCVREKLLGYYIRDYTHNCAILYQDKIENAEQTVALSLIALQEAPTLEAVLAYPHAVNNLKEYTASLRADPDVLKTISQLAYLVQRYKDADNPTDEDILKEAWTHCTMLSKAFRELETISKKITSAEVNEENLALYKKIKKYTEKGNVFEQATQFCATYYQGEREYPASKIHSFFMDEAQLKAVEALEQKELERYGVKL